MTSMLLRTRKWHPRPQITDKLRLGRLVLTQECLDLSDDLGRALNEISDLLDGIRGVLHAHVEHIHLATLTVRASQAGSHQKRGWEEFTDAAIRELAERRENIVFILWGSYAQKKGAFIDRSKHLVLTSPHPSPLSAYQGFFGNHHFSRANRYLVEHGKKEIIW